MKEYIDEQTGMRLTVELEPGGERATAYPPENHLDFTYEELNEAVQRLIARAKEEKEKI